MDVLPRIFRQLTELFRAMSPRQRVASTAISFVVLLGFGWLVIQNRGSSFQAVSFGKVFAADELASAEQALITAGLTGFRRDGQRLLAPQQDLDRYNAALLEFDALPADLGSQMLKQYETLGPFSTDRQRLQMKEALLLQELRRMIKAVPDIDDARVAIATSERRIGWNQKPRATANVTLKPRAGREISTTLVNSLRHVVANMVPDLKPADVTIFDVTKGQAYIGETVDEPDDGHSLQRSREFTRQYEQQIQKALSHIPNVTVTVHVDFDALKSSTIRSEVVRSRNESAPVANRPGTVEASDPHQTGFRGWNDAPTETTREVTEKQLIAATPKSVQVSVSIPRDYLREVITRRVAKGEKASERLDVNFVEEEVITKVERIVGRLIPANSSADAISVTCVDRLVSELPETAGLSANEQLAIFVHQWGNAIAVGGIVFLALMALGMMRRATPPPTPVQVVAEVIQPYEIPSPQEEAPIPAVQTPLPPPDRIAVLRDEIRTMVASDPAASAFLSGQWATDQPEIVRKAAILLLSLDQGLAADVLGKLPREQVERITLAIANAENVTREEQESILDEFKAAFSSRPLMQPAGPEAARDLLERSLDLNEFEPIQRRIEEQVDAGPFAFLHHRHADDVRRLIQDEHPQTIAVIATQLPSRLAAQVLESFPAEMQADILGRLARIGPADSDVLAEIASLLQDRIGKIPTRPGGLSRAAGVLRESERTTSRSVLKSLNHKDSRLASSLRDSLFSFQDMLSLDDTTLRSMLQETDHCQWAVALKGSSDLLRERILSMLSAPMATALKAEIASIGPLRLSEITSAQQQIAEVILMIDSDSTFELPRKEAHSRESQQSFRSTGNASKTTESQVRNA